MSDLFRPKPILKLTALFLGFYLLSYLGYLFPILNVVVFWAMLILTAFVSFKKLEYGVVIVLTELFLGGRGYLFSFNFFGFIVSIRLAIFVLLLLIWFLLYHPIEKYKFAKSKFFLPFAVFSLFIVIGVARGIYFGHSLKNIFFDFNGYLYLAIIFPVFDIISKDGRNVKISSLLQIDFAKRLLKNLVAAGIALSLLTAFFGFGFGILHPEARPDKSGILSFEFETEDKIASSISHSVLAKEELKSFALRRDMREQKQPEYRWSKDTGAGELAFISGDFFRFFSASQIYQVLLIGVLLFFFSGKIQKRGAFKTNLFFPAGVLLGNFLSILIGFSRSLWLGTAVVFLFFLLSLRKRHLLKFTLIFVLAAFVLSFLTYLLAPEIYKIIADRAYTIFQPQTQSTAVTRMNILKSATEAIKIHTFLGSGFGKIITYESVIPGASGTLKVFAFEWQYLEILLKIGLLGLFFYFWLIYKIFQSIRHAKNQPDLTEDERAIFGGVNSALFGFLVLNVTTPYLNHPLGIGFLISLLALCHISNLNQKS